MDKPPARKLKPIKSTTRFMGAENRYISRRAEAQAAEKRLEEERNRARLSRSAWESEAARARAKDEAEPVAPPIGHDDLAAAEREARVAKQAEVLALRGLQDAVAEECTAALEATKERRLAIYRRQLAALVELVSCHAELQAYRSEMEALGYPVAPDRLIDLFPTFDLAAGVERFRSIASNLEGVALEVQS